MSVEIVSRLIIWMRRVHNKNIYRKEKFPYDMRKAIVYATDHGKNIADLSDEEMSLFLINECTGKDITIPEKAYAKIYAEGYATGFKEGTLSTLIDLVKKHKIGPSCAAIQVGMTIDEFFSELKKTV